MLESKLEIVIFCYLKLFINIKDKGYKIDKINIIVYNKNMIS